MLQNVKRNCTQRTSFVSSGPGRVIGRNYSAKENLRLWRLLAVTPPKIKARQAAENKHTQKEGLSGRDGPRKHVNKKR